MTNPSFEIILQISTTPRRKPVI